MTRLIDADALTEQIQKLCHSEYMVNWLGVLIDTQPTVKVEPIEVPKPVKRGKWKQWGVDESGDTYECTECGAVFVFIKDTPSQYGFKYCPNCGAKMDAERREE